MKIGSRNVKIFFRILQFPKGGGRWLLVGTGSEGGVMAEEGRRWAELACEVMTVLVGELTGDVDGDPARRLQIGVSTSARLSNKLY